MYVSYYFFYFVTTVTLTVEIEIISFCYQSLHNYPSKKNEKPIMNNIENLLNIDNIKNKNLDINYSETLKKYELSMCIDKHICNMLFTL